MQVMYERCAAIDVHQKTAVTTALITQPDGRVQQQTRTFATMDAIPNVVERRVVKKGCGEQILQAYRPSR